MDLLTVTNISLQEHGAVALAPLSFGQRRGQKLVVAGSSGAGKSTLLQLIAGLIEPSTGEVRINGSRVRGPAVALVPGHPGVAYLSQKSELPGFLRVEQVLRYASKRPAAEAQAVYALCRIDHLLARQTKQLSGGEQQRVALAQLLLGAPELLLLDEPFSNLDRVHKHLLQQVIEEVGTRLGVTCLLVSHDSADTLPWADELLVLQQGRLVQQGPPQVLYNQPASEYVAGLFGDYSLVQDADWQALMPHAKPAPGATLLVRPEQLVPGPATGGAVGVVQAVRFLGSFYEIDIKLCQTIVRARASRPTYAPGDRVGVAIAPGGGWEL